MAVPVRFISVVIPIAVIEEKCKDIGGLKGVLDINKKWVGKKIKYDEHLYKDGAMSPDDIEQIIEFWKKHGLIPIEEREGKKYWNDLCVIDQFSGPTLPCDWIEYNKVSYEANLKKS